MIARLVPYLRSRSGFAGVWLDETAVSRVHFWNACPVPVGVSCPCSGDHHHHRERHWAGVPFLLLSLALIVNAFAALLALLQQANVAGGDGEEGAAVQCML